MQLQTVLNQIRAASSSCCSNGKPYEAEINQRDVIAINLETFISPQKACTRTAENEHKRPFQLLCTFLVE
jgi:hypothetical protein